jgi:hypothetical protein
MHFDFAKGVAVLERTPGTLRALLAGLPPVWTDDGAPHPWRAGRLDPRARIILAQGPDRRFTRVDREAQFRESQGTPLPELLAEFARLRAENLETWQEWSSPRISSRSRASIPSSGR